MSTSRHTARCSCGAVSVTVEGSADFQAVCSCRDCQERTGSAFGMSAYFTDVQVVEIAGESRTFRRRSAKHRALDFSFCPVCGVTVYWRAEFYPNGIGIAGILLGDGFEFNPDFAVWTQNLPSFASFADSSLPLYARGSSDGPAINSGEVQ